MEKWQSLPIACRGGLHQGIEDVDFGINYVGFARQLVNMEPCIKGGYRRINGFIPYDDAVPGDTNNPVLGVKVALGGVFATRKTGTDNQIYFSSGSGWGSALNGVARNGSVNKARFIAYSISEPVVVQTDGANYAWKYDGSTETLLNGTDAPTAPKYAAEHLGRLVLAPGSITSSFIMSAPSNDEDFTAAGGALEINVGDEITGLYTFREELYIFCRNSIYKLTGYTSSDFKIQRVTTSIGCISHDTIKEVGGDLLFLSTDGIRPISATDRVGDIELASLSYPIQDTLSEDILGSFSETYFSACPIRKKSQYRLFINNINVSETANINFFGRFSRGQSGQNIEWSFIQGFRPYCADSEYTVSQNELAVFGHPTDGYVYQMESGSTFNGTSIPWIYSTPYILFDGDLQSRKLLHKIDVISEFEGSLEMSVDVNFDFDSSNVVQPRARSLSSSGSFSLYGEAVYGTDTYSGRNKAPLKSNLVGSGGCASITFSGSGGQPFIINSLNIVYAIPKGKKVE